MKSHDRTDATIIAAFKAAPCDDCGEVPGPDCYEMEGEFHADGRIEKHCGCVGRAERARVAAARTPEQAAADAALGEELAAAALADVRAAGTDVLRAMVEDVRRYRVDEAARLRREARFLAAVSPHHD